MLGLVFSSIKFFFKPKIAKFLPALQYSNSVTMRQVLELLMIGVKIPLMSVFTVSKHEHLKW